MGVRRAETARGARLEKRRKHPIASTARGEAQAPSTSTQPMRKHTEPARATPTAPPAGSPIRPRGCGFPHRCCGWSVINGHAPGARTQPQLLTHYTCTTLALHCPRPSCPASTASTHTPTHRRLGALLRHHACIWTASGLRTPPPCPTNLPSAPPAAAAATLATAAAALTAIAVHAQGADSRSDGHERCGLVRALRENQTAPSERENGAGRGRGCRRKRGRYPRQAQHSDLEEEEEEEDFF